MSLLTEFPLIAEWHPTKNGDLKPENITSGSGKKSMVVVFRWS